MDEKLLHMIIADIAHGAIKICKINRSDFFSYNKKIDDLSENIFKCAALLHEGFFPNCEEGVNNAETQDS